MQIQKLQLINFKNYSSARLEFTEKINVLVGRNGSGKTNLLDAIHFLSLTKSAFASADNHCIRHGEKFFSIKAEFGNGEASEEIFCAVQSGSKKVMKEGANEYQKLSDHIGKYPVVLIAPDDTSLVDSGSEERRKFFDSIISQLDRAYLESLIQYTHVLRQRNSLLKMFGETNKVDSVALDTYDRVLIPIGKRIAERRRTFVSEFTPEFQRFYSFIVDRAEQCSINYVTELDDQEFESALKQNRQRDILLQRTNFGVHRDDYLFIIDGGELKRLGSQGQKKSFIISMKLAHFSTIRQKKNLTPILLLDDIFDKLDDSRIEKLLTLIKDDSFGQLFITDARPDRTAGLLDEIGVTAAFFSVDKGIITQE
jgi:DNA replication and repair protein RecF